MVNSRPPLKKYIDKLLYVAWDNGVLFQISIPDITDAIDADLTVISLHSKKTAYRDS
jgi:hypothetical protein